MLVRVDGRGMQITVHVNAKKLHHHCAVILDTYRRIFARAGLRGISALSARRMIAGRLQKRGYRLSLIGEVLGIRKRSSVKALLNDRLDDDTQHQLKDAMKELL